MAYKVVVTNDAKENMQEYIEYILYEKKNQQAAGSLLDDFEYTKDILAEVAGSLKLEGYPLNSIDILCCIEWKIQLFI